MRRRGGLAVNGNGQELEAHGRDGRRESPPAGAGQKAGAPTHPRCGHGRAHASNAFMSVTADAGSPGSARYSLTSPVAVSSTRIA